MTDIDAIVKGLTKAERDAVCGRYSFADPWEEDEGERKLYELGLWRWPKRGESIVTPLGIAVRDRIMQEMGK